MRRALLCPGSLAGQLALFAGAVSTAWLLISGPAFLLAGGPGVLGSALAAALCLVPGLVVLSAGRRWQGSTRVLLMTLGSTLLRMAVVLGVGTYLYFGFEQFTVYNWVIWLVVFYLLTLALETGILAASSRA